MAKPLIAIDIDEVIFPYTPEYLKFYNQHNGANLKLEDVEKYYYIEDLYPDYTIDQIEELIVEFVVWAFHHHLKPFDAAIAGINKLKERYDIVIVTSRHPDALEATEQWLAQHFPGVFNGIHFIRARDGKTTKLELCEELGVTTLIDDHPEHLEGSAKHKVRGLMFGDYFWNRSVELSPGVERVKDWKEVEEALL